jgi:flagellar basal-body rod protein FlgC
MGLFDAFRIAGSGMAAQGQRLNVVSSNLANADSTTGPDGQAYRAKQVVFEALPLDATDGNAAGGVRVKEVVDDPSPMRRTYDPSNPLADPEGYVSQPNVNVVEEMVNMISASRSYQTNVEVMNTAKALLLKTLTLGS